METQQAMKADGERAKEQIIQAFNEAYEKATKQGIEAQGNKGGHAIFLRTL